MAAQYWCGTERRRQAVAASGNVNGIEYLEVSQDQTTLQVYFIHNLPGAPLQPVPPGPLLTEENVVIEGGVRIKPISIQSIAAAENVLTVVVSEAGDFSTYTLKLRTSEEIDAPPPSFDPQLSEVHFSFKVACPNHFDCKRVTPCPPAVSEEIEIDYLAKDYASFRRLMLDRMAVIMPDWQDRNPADVQVALVELLAYVGDHLSYFQDAVATEAYLGTALKRVSLRRHTRLLDYFMHDGCNARTWLVFEVNEASGWDGGTLETGSRVFTAGPEQEAMLDPPKMDEVLFRDRPVVFETMHPVTLRSAHNEILLYTWSDTGCCLPTGSTRATLKNDPSLSFEVGDLLLFEEVRGPRTGEQADADPGHRHAVRLTRVVSINEQGTPLVDPVNGTPILEVEWGTDDALPFPVCVSVVTEDGTDVLENISVVRGNVALADHGLSVESIEGIPDPVPERPPENGLYRPRLRRGPVTMRGLFNPAESASQAVRGDVRKAAPVVTLLGDGASWSPRYDLLGSDRFASEFVVETESDGATYLRFGDGFHGRKPGVGAIFIAQYRIGNGTAGNVGAEALTRIVAAGDGIKRVRNPLAGTGGTDPEPMEEVRLFAPHAFRIQNRAVTEPDYEEVTERRHDVQKAAATIRWTGSWYTAFVTVDRLTGLPVDSSFEDQLRTYLDVYRMAGCDLEINAPVFIPLDIGLEVCVEAGYRAADVQQSLLEAFSNSILPDGRRGFFHPDNFTFGRPLYLSQVHQTALKVAGVRWVNPTRFQRFGKETNQELERGVLVPTSLEVLRLDNDPSFPENGRLEFVMTGGT